MNFLVTETLYRINQKERTDCQDLCRNLMIKKTRRIFLKGEQRGVETNQQESDEKLRKAVEGYKRSLDNIRDHSDATPQLFKQIGGQHSALSSGHLHASATGTTSAPTHAKVSKKLHVPAFS